MTRRVLVLQHERFAPAASFGDWAAARGFEPEIHHLDASWLAPCWSSYALVVSLGSRDASYDDDLPWVAREIELLRAAHTNGVPVFGICFGAQTLALALGGGTKRAQTSEIGWREVEPNAAWFPPGPWLFWHDDCFEVPPGGQLLARTKVGPAAFRSGHSMGVQFHPEATPEVVDRWLELFEHELDASEYSDLRQGTSSAASARAWQLYDLFLSATDR